MGSLVFYVVADFSCVSWILALWILACLLGKYSCCDCHSVDFLVIVTVSIFFVIVTVSIFCVCDCHSVDDFLIVTVSISL